MRWPSDSRQAALDRTGGLPARLALGYALAWQGRGPQADSVLAAVDPDELSPSELLAWALPRAANQFWMLSEPAQATAFLQSTRNRVSSPTAQTTLDALAATFAMNAGTPLRTLRIAGEVLASPHADGVAVGWAASAAALSSARTGHFDDVEALARQATAADHPGLLRFTSGFGRITALVMAGRLTEARALAQRYTDFAELRQQPGRAIGDSLVGYVAIAQGDFDDAVRLLSRAADPLARTGYSWGPLSLMLLTQALGQQGEQLEAAKVLSRAESRHGLKSTLFAPELALAKAWSKAARGDTTGAIEAAREAVQTAERGGQSAIALRALQDAARLGDVRAVQRAQRLAVEVNCVLGRLTLAHARALAAGDAGALTEVAPPCRPRTAPRGRRRVGPSATRLGAQVSPQHCHGVGDLVDRHQFAAGVREVGIAGPVVDRGDATGGEPRYVGPPVFRPHLPAGGVDEALRRRVGKTGQRSGGHVGLLDPHVEAVENLMDVAQRSLRRSVGSEAEVHRHRGRVGDDVAGNAAIDAYGRQSLTVGAAVDLDTACLVGREPIQHRTQLVNGVVTQPCSRRVGASPVGLNDNSERSLAPGLDVPAGRFAKDRHVGRQPIR